MHRPQMKEMQARRRGRLVLFWFTVGLIVVVSVVAVVTILRAFRGSGAPVETLLIEPGEVSLCAGGQQRFTSSAEPVTWRGTGGTISGDGLFIAGGAVGDFTVIADQEETGASAQVPVHVVACTATPPPAPPTAASTVAPTAGPTAMPEAVVSVEDPQGDVGTYETGAAVDGVPNGVDIRTCSIGADLRVVLLPGAGVPAEAADWVREGEMLLWAVLYDPIPNPPNAYVDWVFALDLDGNTGTGRSPGQARINPGLGDVAALGLAYDAASGEYVAYFLAWNPQDDGWTAGPEEVRYYISNDRTMIALALPLQTLTDFVAGTTGVAVAPELVRGRSAVLSYVGDQAVIDLCPDPPE
jgi:hypothetical protein